MPAINLLAPIANSLNFRHKRGAFFPQRSYRLGLSAETELKFRSRPPLRIAIVNAAKLATFMARKLGLYRRKASPYWWVNIRLPDGRRVCRNTHCVNRAEAQAAIIRLRMDALKGREQQAPAAFTWAQAVARYLEECTEKKSLHDDRDHLRKLEPYLRSKHLATIDMTALQPFIRERKEKDGVAKRDGQPRARNRS